MSNYEYSQIQPFSLIHLNGVDYVWTESSWQKNTATLTLSKLPLTLGQGTPLYTYYDYLESGGGTNAYIDTGVCIGGQGKVEIDDMVVIDGIADSTAWIGGAWSQSSNVGYTLRSRYGHYRGRYSGNDYPDSASYILGSRYRYVRDKNVITFYNSDDTIFYTITRGLSTAIPTHSHYLLAHNENGTAWTTSTRRRIGRVQLTDDSGILVRDFRPAVRIADGVSGMHDVVNDVFYPSANGVNFQYGNF
jgi:hypothetical protein